MYLIDREPDTIMYFGPWVFPAYSYDAQTNNLVDETPIVQQVFYGLLVGVGWGTAVAIFVEPLGVGVIIACVFLMALATVAAACVSSAPNKLGIAAQFLDSSLVREAGDVARETFIDRQADVQVECKDFSEGTTAPTANNLGHNSTERSRRAAKLFKMRDTA
ncbi:unnamed protein product, partial [Choristocarpus tenellus]